MHYRATPDSDQKFLSHSIFGAKRNAIFVGQKDSCSNPRSMWPNCSARWSFDVCAAKCLRVTLNWIRFWTALQCNHCKCHHHSYSLFKSNNYPFKWCRMIWARLFIKSLSNTRLTLAHKDNIRDRDFIVLCGGKL